MTILWSPEAIEDLTSLRAYIAEDNPAAAKGVVLRILHNIEQLLSNNPQMGAPAASLARASLSSPEHPSSSPVRHQRL